MSLGHRTATCIQNALRCPRAEDVNYVCTCISLSGISRDSNMELITWQDLHRTLFQNSYV